MRHTNFVLVVILLAALAVASQGRADPAAGQGFRIEVRRLADTMLSGLAEDGPDLLVTDLASGRLIRLMENGDIESFGPVLPFGIDVIGDPSGPYRIAPRGDGFVVAQGWTPIDADESPYDHAVLAIGPDGEVEVLSAAFWNPFKILVDGDAMYVLDAGRNSLELLGDDGRAKTVRDFPRLKQESSRLSTLSPTEFSGRETYDVDAVPTGLALAGGRMFVSLFTGFPYLEQGGVVISFDASAPRMGLHEEVGGLNMPVDITFDADGKLLVLEHGRFDQATGFEPGSGRLIEINLVENERRAVVTGLTRPVSVLVRASGEIAVTSLDGTLITIARE